MGAPSREGRGLPLSGEGAVVQFSLPAPRGTAAVLDMGRAMARSEQVICLVGHLEQVRDGARGILPAAVERKGARACASRVATHMKRAKAKTRREAAHSAYLS